MKIKAIFDQNDRLLGWLEVTEAPIDFAAENSERVYEVEVDDDLTQELPPEEIESKIRKACTNPAQ